MIRAARTLCDILVHSISTARSASQSGGKRASVICGKCGDPPGDQARDKQVRCRWSVRGNSGIDKPDWWNDAIAGYMTFQGPGPDHYPGRAWVMSRKEQQVPQQSGIFVDRQIQAKSSCPWGPHDLGVAGRSTRIMHHATDNLWQFWTTSSSRGYELL